MRIRHVNTKSFILLKAKFLGSPKWHPKRFCSVGPLVSLSDVANAIVDVVVAVHDRSVDVWLLLITGPLMIDQEDPLFTFPSSFGQICFCKQNKNIIKYAPLWIRISTICCRVLVLFNVRGRSYIYSTEAWWEVCWPLLSQTGFVSFYFWQEKLKLIQVVAGCHKRRTQTGQAIVWARFQKSNLFF